MHFFYFFPFGNVNSDNKAVTYGSLREDCSCTWQPWDYSDSIEAAEKVAQERDKISHSKGYPSQQTKQTERATSFY